MTERTPPLNLQASTYPAEDDRRFVASLYGDSEGIIMPTDLVVTQRGAGANMSVDVAGGRCVVKGDLATYEGSYWMENRGTTNLTISASDPTNPRIDRVIAEVLNAEYSGVSNLWQLRVITGTPAGSPSAPALPNNAISLATVAVAALASSITNANITDLRARAWMHGSTIICTSATRPASPFEGMQIYETDTDQELTYTGSAWVVTARLGAWTTYSPTLGQPGAVTYTATYARYQKIGRMVTVSVFLTVTGTGNATTKVTVSLPFTAVQAGNMVVGSGMIVESSPAATLPGIALLDSTTTAAMGPSNATTGNYLGVVQFVNALASGDIVTMTFTYEATT